MLQGIDVRNPTTPITEALATKTVRADAVATQLHGSFPSARIVIVGTRQLLVTALPQDLAQIRAALTALDAPTATPPPAAVGSEAVRVTQHRPAKVARALTRQVAGLRASVSGCTVVLVGPPDTVSRAKALIAQIDVPSFGARYTQVYRIRSLDATSVADLLRRSFRYLEMVVDRSINALAVTDRCRAGAHRRRRRAARPHPRRSRYRRRSIRRWSFKPGFLDRTDQLEVGHAGPDLGRPGRGRRDHPSTADRRAGRARHSAADPRPDRAGRLAAQHPQRPRVHRPRSTSSPHKSCSTPRCSSSTRAWPRTWARQLGHRPTYTKSTPPPDAPLEPG